MSGRRIVATLVPATALALVLAGCGSEPSWLASAPTTTSPHHTGHHGADEDAEATTSTAPGDPVAAQPPLLYVTTYSGVAAWDPTTGELRQHAAQGLPSPDWSAVLEWQVRPDASTWFVVRDIETNAVRWQVRQDADVEPRVLSNHGDAVALAPTPQTAPAVYEDAQQRPYGLFGRATTDLTIAREDGSSRTYHLAANVEPEAFSLDGQQLFVIQYSPATAPTGYRVRQLDLATGDLHDMHTIHDELLRDMPGSARRQVRSPDGKRLYTLYTERAVGSTPGRAFVHVLDLDEKWAHCVDLPPAFARGSQASGTLAVSPDSRWLYAADAENRALALVDPSMPLVVKEATLDATVSPPPGPAAPPADGVDYSHVAPTGASVALDGTLFVAWPSSVGAFDPHTLRALGGWDLPDEQWGARPVIDASTRPGSLYVGAGGSVSVLDSRNHTRTRTLVPDLQDQIVFLGPTGSRLARISGAQKTGL